MSGFSVGPLNVPMCRPFLQPKTLKIKKHGRFLLMKKGYME